MANITLQKINKTTGDIWEASDISKINSNADIIQTQVNANTTDINNLSTTVSSKVGQSAIDTAITTLKGGVSSDGDTLAKLKALISGTQATLASMQTLLTSDDTNLDTIQEIVTYIKSEKDLLDSLFMQEMFPSAISLDGLSIGDINLSNNLITLGNGKITLA